MNTMTAEDYNMLMNLIQAKINHALASPDRKALTTDALLKADKKARDFLIKDDI
jgi:hypothetical protein